MTADYFNFAKSMQAGSKLYTTLTDHKGVYLFWLYYPFVWISKVSLVPVLIGNVLLFTATVWSVIWYFSKRYGDFLFGLKVGIVYAIVYNMLSIHSTLINTEGLIALAFFPMYYIVMDKKVYNNKLFLVIGLVLGYFSSIKYSSLVYFFGMFLFASLEILTRQKQSVFKYLQMILFGILGFVTSWIPFVVYLVKTRTWNDYWKITFSNSGLTLDTKISYTLCIVGFVVYFVKFLKQYSKGEDYEANFCIANVFFSCIGAMILGHYVSLIVSTLMPCVFTKKKDWHKIATYLCLCVSCFYTMYFVMNGGILLEMKRYQSFTKEIAFEYGLNSGNTLYLTEDFGFGCYSEVPIDTPYEWTPSRVLLNQEAIDELCILNKERFQNPKYKFVVCGTSDLEKETELVSKMLPYIKKYYTLVEDNRFSYQDISIWIRKENVNEL